MNDLLFCILWNQSGTVAHVFSYNKTIRREINSCLARTNKWEYGAHVAVKFEILASVIEGGAPKASSE